MFSMVSKRLFLEKMFVACPNADLFAFSGTGFDLSNILNMVNCNINSCKSIGVFTSVGAIVMDVVQFSNVTGAKAFEFAGSGTIVTDIRRTLINGLTASSIGMDFGTSTHSEIILDSIIFLGNASATCISGLANSGNVSTGGRFVVRESTFTGFTTPLSGIDEQDVRADFRENNGVDDTRNLGNIYINASSTLVIGTIGQWEEIDGINWVGKNLDGFSVTTAGVLTWEREYDIDVLVDGHCTVEKVGGGSDVVQVGIAKNWVANNAPEADSIGETDSSSPISIPYGTTLTLSQNDNIRIIARNQGSTANLVFSVATARASG